MSIRLEKPWQDLSPENVAALTGELGVYQLADESGCILRIGFAGGRSLFGLRGELAKAMKDHEGRRVRFRLEINHQYTSRYEELLMIHMADHGRLPEGNTHEAKRKIGRLCIDRIPR